MFTGDKMEDKQNVWPPALATQGAAGKIESVPPRPPQTRHGLAVLTGLIGGLLYYGVVWQVAYRGCYPPRSSGLVAVAQLPFGLAAPLLPEFVHGLGFGLGLLLLLSFLLWRPLGGFGKGLAVSFVPCLLAFLFVLQMYTTMSRQP